MAHSRKQRIDSQKRQADHKRIASERKFAKEFGMRLDAGGNIAKGGKYKPVKEGLYDTSTDQPFRRTTAEYQSDISTKADSIKDITPRKPSGQYSGERRLLGIATMHKSNMVPVFDEQDAKDIARMRRG
jgi:hypothetical protein